VPDPTDPPTTADQEPSLARQTLEMLVYAPVGLLVTAVEDLPTMATRGRSVLTQTFRNAHLIGQFTVSMGRRELKNRLGRRATTGPETRPAAERADRPADEQADTAERTTTATTAAAATTTTATTTGEPPVLRPVGGTPARRAARKVAGPPASPPAAAGGDATPGAVDLAIPGYDSLSASQVVRRLDGLGPRELDAVYRHESAGRRRRTILHRAQQLLGLEPTPGAPDRS